MKRRLLLLILLAAGLGFSLDMLEQYTLPAEKISVQEGTNTEPDYYGESLEFRQYNSQGNLVQTLTASSSSHIPDNNQTQLNKPVIHSSGSDNSWLMSSNSSTIYDQNEKVQLKGNVVLSFIDKAKDSATTTVKTDSLTYFPDDEIAETTADVAIHSESIETHSTGMRLDIERQRMELLSQVKTRYVP